MNKFNAIPLYKDMLWCNTPEQQHNVGYFDDCFSIEEHQVLLPSVCIQTDVSIEKELLSNSCSENTNILLVFFGCFAPFHEGHLNAIYLSIKQLLTIAQNMGWVNDDYKIITVPTWIYTSPFQEQ